LVFEPANDTIPNLQCPKPNTLALFMAFAVIRQGEEPLANPAAAWNLRLQIFPRVQELTA
jgi:hypothetical protein